MFAMTIFHNELIHQFQWWLYND